MVTEHEGTPDVSRDADGWGAGTWDGSRRAQLRRVLKLMVSERPEALESLSETSRRLVETGRKARTGE
jgi:hypothetical protein